jgi:hypothetical protein
MRASNGESNGLRRARSSVSLRWILRDVSLPTLLRAAERRCAKPTALAVTFLGFPTGQSQPAGSRS